MPYSIVHFEVALKILERKKLCPFKNVDFMVGNLIPDTHYVLKRKGIDLYHEDTHFLEGESFKEVNLGKNFLQKGEISSLFLCGYYCHLSLDNFWKNHFFAKGAFDKENRGFYQASRKKYAGNDKNIFLEKQELKNIIDTLYNYDFSQKNITLPLFFKKIDPPILKESFSELLDIMLEKKVFFKKEEEEIGLHKKENKIIIPQKVEEKIQILFPEEEYRHIKKASLDELYRELFPKQRKFFLS